MLTNQQRISVLFWSVCLLVLSLVLPALFHADLLTAGQLSSNGHFERETPSMPLHFETDSFGRTTAFTAGGNQLRKASIIDADDTYLQRIDVDGTFFYISDRGVITADSDTIAVSIYHGLAV